MPTNPQPPPLTSEAPTISVIAPIFNEAQILADFYQRLRAALVATGETFEIIFIDDGSSDATPALLEQLRARASEIGIISLSRNFGKEVALTAGLDHCRGAAAIVIDTDLQDPPELIGDFIREWRNGYDVVYGQRLSRSGESWLKKATAHAFYRLIRRASHLDIPEDTGDFRLLSRRAIEAVAQLRERHRFMKGIFSWVGFPQKAIPYHRQARLGGTSKWNYWRLWNFALEGITSFSTLPLRIATYMGLLVACGAFVYGGVIIFKTLRWGNPVPGYPSLMVVILFLGGIQLIGIGIMGEYLGRMYNETKQRPLYLLKAYHPAGSGAGPGME